MSLIPQGNNPRGIVEWAFDVADALFSYSHYIYYWLKDFAPIILKYKLIQMGRNGIDNLPFISWQTKQEIKRWLRDYYGL